MRFEDGVSQLREWGLWLRVREVGEDWRVVSDNCSTVQGTRPHSGWKHVNLAVIDYTAESQVQYMYTFLPSFPAGCGM